MKLNWSGAALARSCFVILFLIIQIALPAWLLFERGLSLGFRRFGWQMYSSVAIHPTFQVERADGSLFQVSPDFQPYAIQRAEVSYDAALPPHLCRQVEGAKTVIIQVGNAAPRRYACQPF